MSVYPYILDDDATIIRVDDNITEIAGQNFNQVRDAVFKIERELGVKPSGAKNSLKEFLTVSHNTDGSIKSDALEAVGLVTLPIDNSDVGTNAGILESKLSLTHSTSDLYSLISGNASNITLLQNLYSLLNADLTKHVAGGPAADLRHVISHIDINAIPFDSRDSGFVWTGLKTVSGGIRSATHLGQALEEINDELVDHQLAVYPTVAHTASSISVDASDFEEISGTITNVQDAIEALDSMEQSTMGIHNATMHSNGVPVDARSYSIVDGYGPTVVSVHQATTYLAHSGTAPIDSTLNGDNVAIFTTPLTDAEKYLLDSQMVLVVPGDIARINYGNGTEAISTVESVRFIPGTQWAIRLNNNNLIDTTDAYIRIDRPLFDKELWGVAAVAASNAYPTASFSGFLGSVIVADPRAAVALGNGFDPNRIDETHYNLYLQLYPTGNPVDHAITLAAIDVSGNMGSYPGQYTLETVVQATNNSLREAGMNARFVAFAYEGNFGIAMADAISGASFSIVTGERSGSSIIVGSYTNNVVGDASAPIWDALGLGAGGANYASPAYSSASFADSIIALKPTKILMPRQNRCLMVNGSKREFLKSAPGAVGNLITDGYWNAVITDRITISGVTVKTEYHIDQDLRTAGLFPGKTITVQPSITFSSVYYKDSDYGRYILESVAYTTTCPGGDVHTILTVINGVHAIGDPEGSTTGPGVGLTVRIHFDNTSVGFNQNNLVDVTAIGSYHRLHEIYGKSDSSTLSHERLRMPVQAAAGYLLGTTDWRVRGASPKLQGFADTSFGINRYVRFYILDYDVTSGEFDGYIGHVGATHTITEFGPITSGRKNVPVRFYDNTGNDYIELEFLETSAVPAAPTPIAFPAYVDIQIFPTLALDDELTLLATCEVNWQTPTTQIVERVIDCRQRGSVSESEFTQSAKDYISAADKHLHNNGIIRGFEYFSGIGSDSIVMGGGVAIVNGIVVTANDATIQIPYVTDNGTTTLDWGICVDEYGNFVAIPITTTKRQFFATNSNGVSYYIPSVTFQELILTRRDLVLTYIVSVTIASVTINTAEDARVFIEQESVNIPYTWADSLIGGTTFRSIIALRNWINRSGGMKNTIIARGDFTVDTYINLTGFINPITIVGEAATFTISAPVGLLIGSNVTLRNIDFVYEATGQTYADPDDIVNIEGAIDRGAIFVEATGITVTDICIENCTFTSSDSQRGPFINFSLSRNSLVDTVYIRNNKFTDTGNTDNCAIVFNNNWTAAVTGGDFAPTLANTYIENNIATNDQTLILASDVYIFITTTPTAGDYAAFVTHINPINVNISKNTFGAICTCFASSEYVNTGVRNSRGIGTARITDNTCKYIVGPCSTRRMKFLYTTLVGTGLWTGYYIPQFMAIFPSGQLEINGNSVSNIWAYASVYNWSSCRGYSSVSGNTLRPMAVGDSLLDKLLPFDGSMFGTTRDPSAITAYSSVYSDLPGLRKITGITLLDNDIESHRIAGDVTYYNTGITAVGSHIISNNKIGGFTYRGIEALESTNNGEISIITSNIVATYDSLPESALYKFIHIDDSINSTVKNNTFNRPFLTSTDDNIISDPMVGSGQMFCNTNQTVEIYIPGWVGKWVIANGSGDEISHLTALPNVVNPTDPGAVAGVDVVDVLSNPSFTTSVGTTALYLNSAITAFRWMIPLSEIIPLGAKLVNVRLDVSGGTADVNVNIRVFSLISVPVLEDETGMVFTGADAQLPDAAGFTPTGIWHSTPTNTLQVEISTSQGPISGAATVKYLYVQYRF